MLSILNNTFLDSRTALEKQLDAFIEKRNFERRIKKADKLLESLSDIEYKKVVAITASILTLYSKNVLAFDLTKVKKKGDEIIFAIQLVVVLTIVAYGMIEVAGGVIAKEDKKFFTNIFFKYVIVMAIICFFPKLYSFVEEALR